MGNVFSDAFKVATANAVVTITVEKFDPNNRLHQWVVNFWSEYVGKTIGEGWTLVFIDVAGEESTYNSSFGNSYEDEKIVYLRRGTRGAIVYPEMA